MNRRVLWIILGSMVFIVIVFVVVIVLRGRAGTPLVPLVSSPSAPSASNRGPSSATSVYDITPDIQAARDLQKQNAGQFPADYQSTWTPEQIQAAQEADAHRGFRPTSTTP